ncbi:MAG: polysaccharide pyruvyl transferase family protein [Isosphaeraceae bacterium]
MNRRTFLQSVPAAALAARVYAAGPRPPRILLRSSWQTVNIGDIAHTPGVLTLIEKHLPEAEVTLWPSSVGEGVREMLLRRFPRLVIAQGAAAQKKAIAESDFLLHGSGPSLVGADTVERWANETGKPYGVYGITVSPGNLGPREVRLLNGARFVFFRDSVSLELARAKGVKAPLTDFGPDGAFAVDLRDDAKATAFLSEHGLEPGRFLCCLAVSGSRPTG